VTRSALAKLLHHAIGGLPDEVAGLLGADDRGVAVQAIALKACRATTGALAYRADALAAADGLLARQGLRTVARYHSHPRFPARPGMADRLQMTPDRIEVIVGFRGGPGARARAWRLAPGALHPDPVEVRVMDGDR
jgi:proteasome lid subunit RPN8/RPN11